MVDNDLTIAELQFIHNAHNREIDCDCEECREYRRQVAELRHIIAGGHELCGK